ncbi:MAG: hypothetical protein L6V78_03310 [Clostridium sp.]|nr:MAG: hypothetical protein L6V78_03310 [Clostridium sp.]
MKKNTTRSLTNNTKIICLLKQECTKAKEEYIKNKNKKYVYMEENLSEIATKEISTDEKKQ